MTDPHLTYAIVFATLLGPIIAVLITRWQDARDRTHRRRAETFRTLMATRGTPISNEHVGAMNTVEVDFYGVKNVEVAWSNYIAHLNAHPGRDAPDAAKNLWEDVRKDRLAIMLAKMATVLGIIKSEIEIRRGGYAPEGWATRDARQLAAQDWLLDLAQGKRAIPIKVFPDKE